MKNVIIKDTVKEIKNTFKRFLSILLVVLLGVGFFAGIKATSPDMKKTVDQYFDGLNVMDIQVISTLGITQNDIEILKNVEDVDNIEGSYSQDVIVTIDEKDAVIKLETLTSDINKLILVEGRLPENVDECVVEENLLTWTGHKIGDSIEIKAEEITDDKGNKKELLKSSTMEIVGTVQSPIYLSRERGNTKLGSGKINYYMYVGKEAVQAEIYTTAYITAKDVKQLDCTSNNYEDIIKDIKDRIKEISDDRKQARYDEIYDEADKKIKEAQDILNKEKEKAEKEISDAEKKINDAKQEIEKAKKELETNRRKANTEFVNAENKIREAEKDLNQGEKAFQTVKTEALKQINEYEQKLKSLKEAKTNYEALNKNLNKKQTELNQLNTQLGTLDPDTDAEEITKINQKIAVIAQEIYGINAAISMIGSSLNSQGVQINQLSNVISSLEKGIKDSKKQLKEKEDEITNAKQELKKQKNNFKKEKANAYAKLNQGQSEIEKAEKEIKENETKLKDAKKEADEKIADAQEELDEAKIDLNDIKKPEWYILDRNHNTGYASYIQDTDRIANIATVFPVVFFVVAALISLTSMSRMVEEERVQIGTLKALGYTKGAIASKYLIYAILATLIGSVIGLIIGFNFLPAVITNMYSMVYVIPKVILEFNMRYALIGTLAAIFCTVGATIYSCTKELKQTPAEMMRPKAPKPGKRVFLEKITFIWSKMNFTQKVTARNIFRYKKRFLMTIIGVMGCTSLILAGFGLRDAVAQMIPSQYGEIFHYDIEISLKDDITTSKINEESERIKNREQVTGILKENIQAIEVTNIENTQNIQLIVPENIEELSQYISLRSRSDRNHLYTLNNEGVILTEKLAKILKLKVGDSITLKNSDDIEVNTKVANITENYLMHYIYMSPELYQQLYGEEIVINNILVNTIDLTEDEQNVLGASILEDKDYVSGVSFISNTQDIFADVMENMNFVVWVLIVAAGLLAFVVLYNLSNTNISERIRELATIKVLGFYDKEVYDYVSREMIILTIIGILFGLVAGVFLTMFIIKTCELDILMFDTRIHWSSYIYAVIITIFFAAIVNIATYFALKKINMIESLKSVE